MMEKGIEERLIALKDLADITPVEQQALIKKLLTQVKQSGKQERGSYVKQEVLLKEESYYNTLEQKVSTLERKIKNVVKFKMSDYQAFKWNLKKIGYNHKLPELFPMLKIPDQLRRLSLNEVNCDYLNIRPLTCSVEQLCSISASLVEQNGKELIKNKPLQKLIRLIAQEYNITSYHNFSHAVSVLLLFKQIEKITKIKKHFDQSTLFIVGIAALAHDMGHRGTNASWEKKRSSLLAKIYEGQSILQMMHISRFFRLLKQNSQLDFFEVLKDKQRREKQKKLFICLILATDMSNHCQALEYFTNKAHKNPLVFLAQEKQTVLELIFHGCDIGNSCLEFDDYLNWSILLGYQFNHQSLMEEKEHLQVSVGLRFESLGQFYKGQMSFISNVCVPLWKAVEIVFPQVDTLRKKMEQNMEKLGKRLKLLHKN